MVPRIISVTDGVNLVLKNSSNTGLVKVHIEEVMSPDTVRVTIDDQPAAQLEIFRIDPRPPRHLLDIVLPKGLSAGSHMLQIHIGPRRVLTAPLACQ
jgi:hypothetical protein